MSITSTTFSGTTAIFAFNDPLAKATSGVTYTVRVNFGPNASGTFGFSIIGASGNNGQAAQFSGLPVAGAAVTALLLTSTLTGAITNTPDQHAHRYPH